MTTAATRAARAEPVARRARLPWWAQVLAVWLATRAFSALVLLVVARTQAATIWADASPSYAEYTGLWWDGSWYRAIAEDGYPDGLPRGEDGRVLQNAWAFFPLFPALARTVMSLTGGPWHVVAPTLALLLGAAGALAVHQVVAAAVGTGRAARTAEGADDARDADDAGARVRRALPLATVAVLGASAAASVFQVAYTESLALLLLACALWALVRRRYLLAVPAVLALGFTRAVALPLGVAVLAHAVSRVRAERRGEDELRAADWAGLAGLAAASGVAGFAWPAVVGLATGVPDAYTQTQAAWRARGEVVPVLPWFDVAWFVAGHLWLAALVAVVGLGVLVCAVGPIRRLGPEMRGWTAGYLAYLLVAIEPGTSLVRFLLLAFPVAAVVAWLALRARHARAALAGVLVAALISQVAWVALIWRLVPPSGWPP